MSLLDCEKCWNTPCSCGHEYKTWSTERLVELRDVLQKELDARGPEEGREAFEAYQEATAKAQREHDPRAPFRREYQGQWLPMPTAYRRRGGGVVTWRVVVVQNGVVTLSGPGPCRGRKVVTIEKFRSEWEPV